MGKDLNRQGIKVNDQNLSHHEFVSNWSLCLWTWLNEVLWLNFFSLIMLMANDGSEFWPRGDFSTIDDDCDFFGDGNNDEDLSININTLLDILGEDPQPSQLQVSSLIFLLSKFYNLIFFLFFFFRNIQLCRSNSA